MQASSCPESFPGYSAPVSQQSTQTRFRESKSLSLWSYMTLEIVNTVEKIRCNICDAYFDHVEDYSNLLTHLQTEHTHTFTDFEQTVDNTNVRPHETVVPGGYEPQVYYASTQPNYSNCNQQETPLVLDAQHTPQAPVFTSQTSQLQKPSVIYPVEVHHEEHYIKVNHGAQLINVAHGAQRSELNHGCQHIAVYPPAQDPCRDIPHVTDHLIRHAQVHEQVPYNITELGPMHETAHEPSHISSSNPIPATELEMGHAETEPNQKDKLEPEQLDVQDTGQISVDIHLVENYIGHDSASGSPYCKLCGNQTVNQTSPLLMMKHLRFCHPTVLTNPPSVTPTVEMIQVSKAAYKRQRVSDVWKYMTKIPCEGTACCNICFRNFYYIGGSTTAMLRHLKNQHSKEFLGIVREKKVRKNARKPKPVENKDTPPHVSGVWKFMTAIEGEGTASCDLCDKYFYYLKGSTTSMLRHLKTRHSKEFLGYEVQRERKQPRLRLSTSVVWKHMKVTERDNKTKVECNLCDSVFAYVKCSTTNLIRHLRKNHSKKCFGNEPTEIVKKKKKKIRVSNTNVSINKNQKIRVGNKDAPGDVGEFEVNLISDCEEIEKLPLDSLTDEVISDNHGIEETSIKLVIEEGETDSDGIAKQSPIHQLESREINTDSCAQDNVQMTPDNQVQAKERDVPDKSSFFNVPYSEQTIMLPSYKKGKSGTGSIVRSNLSGVWKFMTKISNTNKTSCDLCSRHFVYDLGSSTTSMLRHLKVQHSKEFLGNESTSKEAGELTGTLLKKLEPNEKAFSKIKRKTNAAKEKEVKKALPIPKKGDELKC